MSALVDRIGQATRHMVVLDGPARLLRGTRIEPHWLCECRCGFAKWIASAALSRGQRSCGCEPNPGGLRHGHARDKTGVSPTYGSYTNMVARCTNPRSPHYANYGARGVSICERWRQSFEAFLSDMGERPPGTTLDRIDNAGPYSPENCRWATRREQQRNRRANHVVQVAGRSVCITEAAEILGLSQTTIRKRLREGIPLAPCAAAEIKG
jgi:hypothetical protein